MLVRSLSALLLLVLFAPTASAQVTITVEGLVGVVPDTDDPLSGLTDPFVRVFVEIGRASCRERVCHRV